jgi:single-strand DNA-binding protein
VGRGDPLLVTGRMRVREWDNGEGKPRGYAAEIEATAMGHDLSRGTSAFRRTVRARPELVAKASTRTTEPTEDSPGGGPAADPRLQASASPTAAPVLVGAAPPADGERRV